MPLPAGTTVFEQGAPGDAYFVVEDGEVEVIIDETGAHLLLAGGRSLYTALKKGIAFAVITPNVKVLDHEDAYRARLREEE